LPGRTGFLVLPFIGDLLCGWNFKRIERCLRVGIGAVGLALRIEDGNAAVTQIIERVALLLERT
jgi:hypothetical protein